MKNRKTTLLLLAMFFIGLSVLLYPSISSYWNSKTQSKAIVDYEAMLASYKPEDYTAVFEAANAYNQELQQLEEPLLNHSQLSGYHETLNVSGTGMMGYITIPKISQELPVYHGTSEGVLSVAVGHLEGTSLPVGGESTHCVVSGHTGLPSAKLFTNLNQLEKGDTFLFRILDETLTYEVDQILIVLPQETDALHIEEDKDLCTLVTCTPYGVNSHRLLVRGHRVENAEIAKTIRVTADAMQIEPLIVAPLVAVPMLLVLLIMVMFGGRKKGGR